VFQQLLHPSASVATSPITGPSFVRPSSYFPTHRNDKCGQQNFGTGQLCRSSACRWAPASPHRARMLDTCTDQAECRGVPHTVNACLLRLSLHQISSGTDVCGTCVLSPEPPGHQLHRKCC
jgi:hypothetical protein